MKFFFCDTETGGLDPEVHSLLTLTITVTGKDLVPIDSLSLKIKHANYVVTAEALRINKINLVEHDKVAMPVSTAQTLLDNFILTHGSSKDRPIFAGHNPGFDERFITNTFDMKVFKENVSYHKFDSVGLGLLLKLIDVLPEKQSLSLEPLAKALNVPMDDFHTSDGDVRVSINVVKKVVTLWQASLKKLNS